MMSLAMESRQVKDNVDFTGKTALGEQIMARFWELVNTERDRAIGIAYHMTGDREAAKDITQEAFLKAYKSLSRFRQEAKLSTWFYRILVNQAKNHRRRNWLQHRWQSLFSSSAHTSSDLDQPNDDPLPDSSAGSSQLRHRIVEALQRLSLGQRAAFGLVHLEGLTVNQTAEALGISPGAVKSHLHRALKKLRQELSDYKEGQP